MQNFRNRGRNQGGGGNQPRQGGGTGGGGPRVFIAWASATTNAADSFTATGNKGEYKMGVIVGRSDPNPTTAVPCKIRVQGSELAGVWSILAQQTLQLIVKLDLGKPEVRIEIYRAGQMKKADDPPDEFVEIPSSKIKANKGQATPQAAAPLTVEVSLPGPDGTSMVTIATIDPNTGKPGKGTVVVIQTQEFKINKTLVSSGQKELKTHDDGHRFDKFEPMVETAVFTFRYLEGNCTVERLIAKNPAAAPTAAPTP